MGLRYQATFTVTTDYEAEDQEEADVRATFICDTLQLLILGEGIKGVSVEDVKELGDG